MSKPEIARRGIPGAEKRVDDMKDARQEERT